MKKDLWLVCVYQWIGSHNVWVPFSYEIWVQFETILSQCCCIYNIENNTRHVLEAYELKTIGQALEKWCYSWHTNPSFPYCLLSVEAVSRVTIVDAACLQILNHTAPPDPKRPPENLPFPVRFETGFLLGKMFHSNHLIVSGDTYRERNRLAKWLVASK